MEADTMERLGLLVSSLLFAIALNSCNGDHSFVKKDSKNLDLRKRIIEFNQIAYTGYVYELYDNGDTLSVEFYKEGLKNGSWKKFYVGGSLKEIRGFNNGKKEGNYEGFYIDGSKNFSFNFYNGEYHGTNRIWTKDGQLIEELNYLNGYENGSQKVWYLNGKIKSNYVIKNNRRFGLLGTKNCVNTSEEVF
jgi:antitoxin component YwqK of YwqJK toxin-antitoxin module